MFVFVEVGEDLVFLDVEDQVGERAEGVLQLFQVAFECLRMRWWARMRAISPATAGSAPVALGEGNGSFVGG